MADQSMSSGTRLRISAGEYVFREGDTSKDLYVVQFGSVKVIKEEGGVEVELDIVGPGGILGEVAAIDGGPRSASALVVEDAEFLVISVDNFQNVVDNIPDWFRKIARILVQRLREVDSRIHFSTGGDNVPHLAALIHLMCSSTHASGTEQGIEIPLRFLEDDAMDILGMQINDVSVAVDKLQKRKVLRVSKNKIIVTDKRALGETGDGVFNRTESSVAI